MTTTSLLVIEPVTVTSSMLDTDLPETDYSALSGSAVYLAGDRVIGSHFIWESLVGSSSDVTISISATKSPLSIATASPGPITWGGLKHNDAIVITTTGSLPSPLVPNQVYYAHPNSTSTAFLMTEPDGEYITTVDPQSGTHTGWTRAFVTWPKTIQDDGNGGVTLVPHGWPAGTSVVFSTTGALPTGLTAGTRYYVLDPTDEGFYLSATPLGAAIITSGTQSGTHTARASTNYNRDTIDGSPVWSKVSPTNRYKPLDVNPSTRAVLPAKTAASMTIASPCVVTQAGHAFKDGALVVFYTTGALPTGITQGTPYYVKNANTGAGTYQISATDGGAAINTSGTQSGAHESWRMSMRYEITPGDEVTGAYVDSVKEATSVRCRVIDGTTVYDTTKTLTGKTQAIFDDLPAGHPNGTVRFDLYAVQINNEVGDTFAMEVGVIGVGPTLSIGTGIQLGARLSHQSFSRQETDTFGNDVLVVRGRARLVNLTMRVAQADVDSVWQSLTALDSVPCMWRATSLYASLNAYGYFKTMEKLFDMQTYAVLQLGIKSMSTNT